MNLPFKSQYDGHVDGRAEGEVDHWVDEVRVEQSVSHSPHRERPGERVLSHHLLG